MERTHRDAAVLEACLWELRRTGYQCDSRVGGRQANSRTPDQLRAVRGGGAGEGGWKVKRNALD